jgi:hypothetical protein
MPVARMLAFGKCRRLCWAQAPVIARQTELRLLWRSRGGKRKRNISYGWWLLNAAVENRKKKRNVMLISLNMKGAIIRMAPIARHISSLLWLMIQTN